MTPSARWFWLPCLAAVWLLSPAAAVAGSRGLRDGGGFFGKKVVDAVNDRAEDIHRRFGVDVLVETVGTTPADRAAELKQLGSAKFFDLWAEERAMAAGVDGIYILICIAPRHVEITVNGNAEPAFDKRSRDKMRKTLAQELNKDSYGALHGALTSVQERLESREREARRGGWAWVVWVILGIVGVWLLFSLVRRFQGGKTVTPPSAVSSASLAGQSIYQSMVDSASERTAATTDAPTLPYPAPAPQEPRPEGTVHG